MLLYKYKISDFHITHVVYKIIGRNNIWGIKCNKNIIRDKDLPNVLFQMSQFSLSKPEEGALLCGKARGHLS